MISINEQLQQKWALGLLIVLVPLFLATAISTFKAWHTDWVLIHAKPEKLASSASEMDKMAAMLIALPQQHLFGEYRQLGKMGEIPITALQLRVTGIIKMNDGTKEISKAMISIGGQPSKVYQVGDTLPQGVRIYAITPEAVVFENNGQIEKMPLPRQALQFLPPYKEHH